MYASSVQKIGDGVSSAESSFACNANLGLKTGSTEVNAASTKKIGYKDADDVVIKRKVLESMPPMELTSIRR